jgi:hypothetical protein
MSSVFFRFALVLATIAAVPAFAGETSAPPVCPQTPGLTDKDCSLAYLGVTVVATMDPFLYTYVKAGSLIAEAQTQTSDSRCVPQVARFTHKVKWDWFRERCNHATVESVQNVLRSANADKVFCRKLPNGAYDLYSMKRLRDFVVGELERSQPELCR